MTASPSSARRGAAVGAARLQAREEPGGAPAHHVDAVVDDCARAVRERLKRRCAIQRVGSASARASRPGGRRRLGADHHLFAFASVVGLEDPERPARRAGAAPPAPPAAPCTGDSGGRSGARPAPRSDRSPPRAAPSSACSGSARRRTGSPPRSARAQSRRASSSSGSVSGAASV